MIPKTGMTEKEFNKLLEQVEGKSYGSLDYRINGDRLSGYIDDIEAIRQAVYLILSIERFQYITISENTGVEFWELYGKDADLYVIELKNTITEALLNDDRIEAVENFEVKRIGRNKYNVYFDVVGKNNEIVSISEEVNANV